MTITIVARRLNLPPVADSRASEMMGVQLAEIPLGLALQVLPDGIIFFRDDGQYFENVRGQLKPIQEPQEGTVTSVKRSQLTDIDAPALAAEIREMARAFAFQVLTQRGRI